MAAQVSVSAPGRVGDLNADWSVQLDAMPHSPLLQNGSTGEVDFSAKAQSDTHLAMNNSSTFTYTTPTTDPDTGVKVGASVLVPASPAVVSTALNGTIDSVSIMGAQASFTQGTQFTQFATTDIEIPWVSSGSALGAFDLCWQLAGNARCTLNLPGGRYWSLRGHDTGFDSTNTIIYPSDYTAYRLNPSNDGTYYRNWDLRDAFACTQWEATGTSGVGIGADLYSYKGVGSSPSVVPGTRTSIAFSLNTSGTGVAFKYGSDPGGYSDQANGYSQHWGFGPRQGAPVSGKTINFTISPSSKNCTTYFSYGNTGTNAYVILTPTIDLSSLNWSASQSIKVVTDTAWIDSTTFQWSLWFRDVNGVTVSYTSGPITAMHDLYGKPWNHVGGLHGLYQVTSPIGFDPTVLLADYEVAIPLDTTLWNSTDNGGLPPFGSLAYEPILPYTGSLWDYLCQVFTAKEKDLRIRAGRFYVTNQADTIAAPKSWNSIAEPTFSVDNQNVASTVEIDAQIVNLNTLPTIYDARSDGNQTYSFNAGQTSTFTINSSFIGSVVQNPQPVYTYSDFTTNTPYGAFIVTGADELPVPVAQWITAGGSVYVRQTGNQTLEVTVNCPEIWDANGDGGSTPSGVPSYFFGVSDGQNQYGTFSLVGSTGDRLKPVTRVFQTGASYAAGNSSPGAITNPCATSNRMINTLAMQASAIASGPNLTLTGSMAINNVQNASITDLGLIPGTTFFYRNLQWRIISATIQNAVVNFTAAPYSSYAAAAWALNWSSMTVDQFREFWVGKTYDDMKTMVLAAPYWDYTEASVTQKWTVFPSAGTGAQKAIYPGKNTFPGGMPNADR